MTTQPRSDEMSPEQLPDDDPIVQVVQALREGRTEGGLIADMVGVGYDPEDAHAVVTEASHQLAEHREDQRVRGKNLLGIGIFVGLIGAVVTVATYANAQNGGTYIVATGPLVFGPLMAIRGFRIMAKARNA